MFGFGRIRKLEENYERLERIVKYSKNEPTFRIKERQIWPSDINISHTINIENDLYMYIDKEEYCVTLIELNKRIIPHRCDFKIEDTLACFSVRDYLSNIVDGIVNVFPSSLI